MMSDRRAGKSITRLAYPLLAVASALLLAQSAVGQQPGETGYHDDPALPAGVIGQRIESLIQTFNSGDPSRFRRFLEEECTELFRNFVPMEEHLNVFSSIHREWGQIDFHSIRTYTPPRPGETVVIVRDGNFDAWRGIVLRFDGTSEMRIARLSLSDARTPTDVEEAPLTEETLAQEARRALERACDRDAFSGTALIAKGKDILLTHACGEASKRFHVANNIDTKFNLGSMNKMFTATAIVRLVEQGVLSFDDPISQYVDESWLPREMTEKVTIHHLLTHTSGLGSYFNDDYWRGSRELYRTVEDFKPLVKSEQLAFEPGSRFLYSNTGMLLLGVVIESATGQSYFDHIREHIYQPAGMRDSDSYDMDAPVENLAIGYEPAPNSALGWENNYFKHVIRGGPAGGGFSTVGDLHRFALALLTGRYVSEESRTRMWTDHSGEGYGYGFGVEEGPAGTVVGHSGGFPGINGNLDIFVDRGYIVAVLANYSRAANPVARHIYQLIARLPVTGR